MNLVTKIIAIGGLLLCTVGKAQEISLPADSCLNDEIDMGLYSIPKTTITGSVTSLQGESLIPTVSNLSLSFAGKFTGLNTLETGSELTHATVKMYIRGFSSMNSSEPLLMVDGVICPLSTIDYLISEEIENISILKDGSSLAVYGIHGANGVIAVTTKKGSVSPMKAKVWYHHSLQQMTKQPQFISSAQYAKLRNEAAINNGQDVYSQFTPDQINKFAQGNDQLYPNNNWYDMYMNKVTFMQQAGISLQGGNERIKNFTVINYLYQSSPFIIVNEPERKYDPKPRVDNVSIRSNFNVKFNNYLSAFLLLSGRVTVDKTAGAKTSDIYYKIFNTPPVMYGPLTPETILADGNISPQSNQVVTYDGDDYPAYGILNRAGFSRALTSGVYTQTGVSVDLGFLTDGLSLTSLMAYQMYGSNTTTTYQDFERYIRSSNYSALEFTKYKTFENTPLNYTKYSAYRYSLNLSTRIDYKKRFGNHSIQAAAFYFYSKQEKEETSGLGKFPYLNEMTGLTTLYGFRDKYFVKADIGYSGSEQFHSDYRYIATPAVSATWVASQENFMNGVNWLTLLKLRASYGVNGNDQLGNNRYLYSDYIISFDAYEGLRGNPQLSAEKIKKQNYGIDIELLGSISLSLDWFFHRCSNMLISSELTPEFQTIPLQFYPKINNGKMENKGIEIEAGYSDRLSQNISVFALGNFWFARNKVIAVGELPYSDRFYSLRTEGYRRGQLWGYLIDDTHSNGIFTSQAEVGASELIYSTIVNPRVGDFIYKDLNGDKVIDEGDKAPIGHPRIPEIFYSFNGGMQLWNFEVSFLLQGVANTSVYISGAGVNESISQGVFSDMHLNAWTTERYAKGEKTDYPALSLTPSSNHVPNNFFIMDASYLKLRNVEISYSLPTLVAEKIKADNIKISLLGQNLFTMDRMKTKCIDPETAVMANFQPYRVYSVGIKCLF